MATTTTITTASPLPTTTTKTNPAPTMFIGESKTDEIERKMDT